MGGKGFNIILGFTVRFVERLMNEVLLNSLSLSLLLSLFLSSSSSFIVNGFNMEIMHMLIEQIILRTR